jgi:hypothetical protein
MMKGVSANVSGQWLEGFWNKTGPALRAALPQGSIMIPNCESGQSCQDSTGQKTAIPGYNSVMLEYWSPAGGEGGIEGLQQLGNAGTFAQVSAYIKSWGGHDYTLPNLAGFLMGVGPNSYFGAVGEYWRCDGVPTSVPELEKPLGKPLGPATKTMVVLNATTNQTITMWQRTFGTDAKRTRAVLNLTRTPGKGFDIHHDSACCIWWSNGDVSSCIGSVCNGTAVAT